MGNGHGWSGMAFGMVSMMLFWAALIAAASRVNRHVWERALRPNTVVDIVKRQVP
jgi:hypothetical protein